MPLQATSGAASQDAYGGNGVAVVPAYIEEVFSTYLYTGTAAALTITNNIDLSTKGGLTWIKGRSGATGHRLTDTARGVTKSLESNSTAAEATESTGLTAFGTTGFTIGADADYNTSAATYVSWTFRKQPKFFDIVTFAQVGTTGLQTVNHNLGAVPGMIILKNTTAAGTPWPVYHRSIPTKKLTLNSTSAQVNETVAENVTSTSFDFNLTNIGNTSGDVFVAYLFAHDAGGFGLTGTDNVISCGSFTTDGSGNATVDLGYEPQWVLRKSSSNNGYPWYIMDNMRGYSTPSGSTSYLSPNDATAEVSYVNLDGITSTGFKVIGQAAGVAFIYIAIRRGPMKVPTTGTSVYNAIARSGTGADANITGVGFPPDLALIQTRNVGSYNPLAYDRLRGATIFLRPSLDSVEGTASNTLKAFGMDGDTLGSGNGVNASGETYINWFMKRAPSFMDVVCYTGTSAVGTKTHNLGVAPELLIVKRRSLGGGQGWAVYAAPLGNTQVLTLNLTDAAFTFGYWNNTTPTSSVFSLNSDSDVNSSSYTYVAYLFATCAGVSKVGSYTGTATTKQIDCGFTAGARFVLIKRTDSTGDWYVWDTARGIVSGNDPYLLLNSGAAEVTSTDYIDTYSAGFELSSTAPAAINASGGTYIFLAIA